MKFTTTTLVTLISLASAQVTIDNNGTITCGAHPNGTYCLGANIIARCINGIGQAGNCNDNLAGEPPVGVNFAACFDCGAASGRAACSKNGIVYPGSGTGLGSTPFPSNDTSICNATIPGVPYPLMNVTSSAMPTGGPTGTGSTGIGGYPTGTGGGPPIATFTGGAERIMNAGLAVAAAAVGMFAL